MIGLRGVWQLQRGRPRQVLAVAVAAARVVGAGGSLGRAGEGVFEQGVRVWLRCRHLESNATVAIGLCVSRYEKCILQGAEQQSGALRRRRRSFACGSCAASTSGAGWLGAPSG